MLNNNQEESSYSFDTKTGHLIINSIVKGSKPWNDQKNKVKTVAVSFAESVFSTVESCFGVVELHATNVAIIKKLAKKDLVFIFFIMSVISC